MRACPQDRDSGVGQQSFDQEGTAMKKYVPSRRLVGFAVALDHVVAGLGSVKSPGPQPPQPGVTEPGTDGIEAQLATGRRNHTP
jgi:hypothetical protein